MEGQQDEPMAVFTLAYAKLFEQAREDNGTRLDGQGMDEQCMIIKFQENDATIQGVSGLPFKSHACRFFFGKSRKVIYSKTFCRYGFK
jgi:hypothetical protein